MSHLLRAAFAALLLGLGGVPSFAQDGPDWADIAPIFAERCTMCHSGDAAPLGLRLDSLEGARAGSENGPVLIPGDPEASELVRRIRGESEPRMPLVGEPLSPEQIEFIVRWVSEGLAAATAQEAPDAAPAAPDTQPGPGNTEPADGPGGLPAPGEPVTFAHVEPIFLRRCVTCHSDARPGGPPEGLRLDSYENVIQGGERLALLPGRPGHSEIVRRIEGTAQPRMPLDGPPWLSEDEIRLIRQWIEQGAADASGNAAPVPAGREVRLRGILTGEWAIDGAEFIVDSATRIDERPVVGQAAEMRGVVTSDGGIRASRLRAR